MKYVLMIAVFLALAIAAAPAQEPEDQTTPNPYYSAPQGWHGVMSPEDQQKFDNYYRKWVDATRKNDQDDIAGNARHMQEIMTRYNIPTNVPFDQVASNAVPGYPGYPVASYPNGAYPNAAYPPAAPSRLSPDDQRKFDKDYLNWVKAQNEGDQDNVAKNAGRMQEIMARYNIPPSVPYQAIATNGYAVARPGYPNPYFYGQAARRLSADDQHDFDKAYQHWLDARRKKDMDDVDKNARKMEDIMAKYNIPANTPFNQIASPSVVAVQH